MQRPDSSHHNPDPAYIGGLVRQLRARGMTGPEIAAAIGCDRRTLRAYQAPVHCASRRSAPYSVQFALEALVGPDDICGFCGLPGADKIPHPIRWPDENSAGTEFVHATCEEAECARASALITGTARDEFLRNCC